MSKVLRVSRGNALALAHANPLRQVDTLPRVVEHAVIVFWYANFVATVWACVHARRTMSGSAYSVVQTSRQIVSLERVNTSTTRDTARLPY